MLKGFLSRITALRGWSLISPQECKPLPPPPPPCLALHTTPVPQTGIGPVFFQAALRAGLTHRQAGFVQLGSVFLPRGRTWPSDKGAGGEGGPVTAFLGQVEGSSWSLRGWTHPPRSIPGMGSSGPRPPQGPAAQFSAATAAPEKLLLFGCPSGPKWLGRELAIGRRHCPLTSVSCDRR